uniref:Uncharacterized protein n=1 Tax=Glossina pallidipes TaxID=7398 RepID=A0A1B0A0K8_GLOPL
MYSLPMALSSSSSSSSSPPLSLSPTSLPSSPPPPRLPPPLPTNINHKLIVYGFAIIIFDVRDYQQQQQQQQQQLQQHNIPEAEADVNKPPVIRLCLAQHLFVKIRFTSKVFFMGQEKGTTD